VKHGKKPSVRQCKLIQKWGLNPADWLVVKDLPTEIHIQHRHFEKTVKTIYKDVNE
jgi:hypothetical protein